MPKKVLIALPPAMLEQVDFIALCEHRTRSDLIREALRRYLDNFRRTQGQSVLDVATPVLKLDTQQSFEPPKAEPVAPIVVTEPIRTPGPTATACGGTGLEGWTPARRPVEVERCEPTTAQPVAEPVVFPVSLAAYETPENVHDWDAIRDASVDNEYAPGLSR